MTLFYDNGLFTWINLNIQLFSFFMNGGGNGLAADLHS